MLGLDPRFFDAYLNLAKEFDLPVRRAMTGDQLFRTGWRDRVAEEQIFTADADLRKILDADGVKLIRWKDLRDLQR